MGVKKELYTLVKQAVEAIPSVETFGKFNNQFDTEEDECPFNMPAVFFSFESVQWRPSSTAYANSPHTPQQKSDEVFFTLRIAYWSHEDEEDKFLALIDLVDEVYRAVTGLESDYINPIQRVQDIDEVNHTEPVVWQTVFSTMLTEAAVAKNYSPVTATPVVLTSDT